MTTITLLTKPACVLCEQAKAILGRVAADFTVTVEVVPLDGPAGQELGVRAGMVFPPAVLLDGHPFSYGRLSERKLRRALPQRAV